MTCPERAGFDPRHFERLAAVEDRHFWFTTRNQLLAAILGRVAATLPPGARALEIGVGTGNTLRVLERACPQAMIFGMDLYGQGLKIARRRATAALVQGRIEALPFRRPFDLIAAFDVIEHVADDVTALTAIRSQLTPGAWLVITVPAFKHLWSRFDEDSHHYRRYEYDELRGRLVDAGFRVDRLSFFMASLYPLLRATRLLTRRQLVHREAGPSSSAVASNLRVVPVVNALMRATLGAEAWLTAAGCRWPIGTSLLATARAD